MKRTLIICFAIVLSISVNHYVFAQGVGHSKILPYSVDYPMIRASLYTTQGPSQHSRNFGVIKVFRNDLESDLDVGVRESLDWSKSWASYGTLGNGEDVFTFRAARYRAAHQGR